MSGVASVRAGTRVGRYEILALLGRGGMGEVYSALDTNLGRTVALKILPPNRMSDPDRVARFVREARASSALNHPAIVSVHDAGDEDGVHYLAMELVEGEPLTRWMRKRHRPEAGVELMAQVADGLARAHSDGIVHRDLKPDNIMITRDGRAKIVDFGVAKLTERAGRQGLSGVSTPTSRIGTTAYMSPEQVEGRTVDQRSDVFSFGIVLYELLTGRNPFASEQYVDTLHNIAHLEPSLEAITPQLRRAVARCLNKDPEHRYHSMKDVALDLREPALPPPASPRANRLLPLLAVLFFVVIGAVLWAPQRDAPAAAQTAAAPMVMTRLTNSGKVSAATISPDGNYLVHAVREGENQTLYLKQIATGTLTQIAAPASFYFYSLVMSADGNYIYYSGSERSDPNVVDVYQLPLLGGTRRRIASDTEHAFSLSPDGTRVVFVRFNAEERIFKMTVAAVDGSGEEIVLARRYPERIDLAMWQPGGTAITYGGSGCCGNRSDRGLYRLDLGTRKSEKIFSPAFPGVGTYAWLPDASGFLVTIYDREQPPQIWFVPSALSDPRKVTSDLSAYFSVTPTSDSKSFVTVRDTTDANISTLDLDRPAFLHAVTSGLGNYVGGGGVRWLGSSEVLYTGIEGGTNTFYVAPAGGGPPRRIIYNMSVWNPVISPDGTKLVFVSDKSGTNQIWVANIDGSELRQLTRVDRAGAPSFTADGRSVLFLTLGASQYAWKIALDGSAPAEQLTDVPTSRVAMSPDGLSLLCRLRMKSTAEGPLWRTAVMPVDKKRAPRLFSAPRHGGSPLLQWHPDGKTFLYLDEKDGVSNVWAQPVDGAAARQLTTFESGQILSFDMSADGRKLLLARGEATSDAVLIRNFR